MQPNEAADPKTMIRTNESNYAETINVPNFGVIQNDKYAVAQFPSQINFPATSHFQPESLMPHYGQQQIRSVDNQKTDNLLELSERPLPSLDPPICVCKETFNDQLTLLQQY